MQKMDTSDLAIAIQKEQIDKVTKPDTQKHFPKTLKDLETERDKNFDKIKSIKADDSKKENSKAKYQYNQAMEEA